MLRIACILATEKGIEVCWPIHDAVLIQARLDVLEEHIAAMQDCMRQAGEIVLGGFQLRTEAEIVRYPDRYQDKRGVLMWEVVQDILGELATD